MSVANAVGKTLHFMCTLQRGMALINVRMTPQPLLMNRFQNNLFFFFSFKTNNHLDGYFFLIFFSNALIKVKAFSILKKKEQKYFPN